MAGGRPFVVEGVVRLTVDRADERQCGRPRTAHPVAQVDLRFICVLGDHPAEEIGRDAAHEIRRSAVARDADRDVEA